MTPTHPTDVRQAAQALVATMDTFGIASTHANLINQAKEALRAQLSIEGSPAPSDDSLWEQATRHLNDIEAVMGGANGPSIQLRGLFKTFCSTLPAAEAGGEGVKIKTYQPTEAAVREVCEILKRISEAHARWGGWSGTPGNCEAAVNLLRYPLECEVNQPRHSPGLDPVLVGEVCVYDSPGYDVEWYGEMPKHGTKLYTASQTPARAAIAKASISESGAGGAGEVFPGISPTARKALGRMKDFAAPVDQAAKTLGPNGTAPSESSPAGVPVGGGWIPWGGGECPVDKSLLVNVQLYMNRMSYNERAGLAGAYDWQHVEGRIGNIIAYKLAATSAPTAGA